MPPAKILDARFRHIVAQVDDKVVGFYSLELCPENVTELDALFVEPTQIGGGIGRKLMEHAKQLASRLGAKMMIVQADPHAEAFYRAAGGVLVGQQESQSIPGRFLPLFEIDLSGSGPSA